MLKKLLLYLQQRKVLLLISILFSCSFSFAQQKITVEGVISSENNVPLAGVSINIKGSSIGTTTNADGKFTIQVNKGVTLVLSFVGYEEKQVKVIDENSFRNIQMVSKSSALDE